MQKKNKKNQIDNTDKKQDRQKLVYTGIRHRNPTLFHPVKPHNDSICDLSVKTRNQFLLIFWTAKKNMSMMLFDLYSVKPKISLITGRQ